MSVAQFVSQLAGPAEVLTAVLAVLILVSSLDDFIIDALYWGERLLQAAGLRKRPQVPSVAEVRSMRQRPIAIVIPAWDESDVVAAMLQHALGTLEYDDYMVFVGTYPNDPTTAAAVDRVAALHGRIRRVTLPHNGPTCKADCLNHAIAGVLRHERLAGITFGGIVLHDCEDVLQPLELKYLNVLLNRHDMIQLPVIALERNCSQLVAATYMDEFAESHQKDMLVRESIGGSIPSAGVGTCFSRAALMSLDLESNGTWFRTNALTEDYEIGMRLTQLGFRSSFVLARLPTDVGARAVGQRHRKADAVLAVREFFPSRLRSAYRQRARWILGIGLQSWSQLPLRGRRWPDVYLMLHDRKGVLTSFVPGTAYVLIAYSLAFGWGVHAGWWQPYTPTLFRAGSIWTAVMALNLALLAVRPCHRVYFTGRMYGWRHGLMSIPRIAVGNIVNFFAAARAWRLYLAHRFTGKPLTWDKTSHEFPALAPIEFTVKPEPIATLPPAHATADAAHGGWLRTTTFTSDSPRNPA